MTLVPLQRQIVFQKKHILWIAGGLLFAFLLFKINSGAGTKSLKVDRDKKAISTASEGQFNDYIRVNGQV